MTRIRCGLYTRKSSEEGLDQEYNSLDAQRDACEAYVKSQASEGWRALPAAYDDGGYSGGTMERPALERLLADIAAGRIDVVVVYKIDRLSRSLADFARMVELFDRHDVSFVSVTQAFNTTSSMGRLMLNVLLSFAQFEREVTGERIRDKIAASKARGMWMGGTLPLGYDLPVASSRALVPNTAEADTVRTIFETYLELGSVHALERWLDARGIRSKQRSLRDGRTIGGQRFSRGALFHLLRNRTYLGLIVHGDLAHPGMHPAIIDQPQFDRVQAMLTANARRQSGRSGHVARAALTGRIFDGDGQPMSPTFSHGRRGQVYRYYVSAMLQQGRRFAPDDAAVRRVSANAIETIVAATLQRVLLPTESDVLGALSRLEVHSRALQLLVPIARLSAIRSRLASDEQAGPDPLDPTLARIVVPLAMRVRGGRIHISGAMPPATRRDPVLIKALRAAHAMVEQDKARRPRLDAAPASPYLRKLVRLAFLAPDLQAAILAGRQPQGLTLERLMATPIASSWAHQRTMFADVGRP